ncbi:flavin reductase family protein [Pseudoalteromonas sp. Q18-MNA-CIBAN-0097]|uniref:flavin reductase family protein n=1 Tax=Pseudoalteromonas TaxID=53246 RepID=UPI0033235F49
MITQILDQFSKWFLHHQSFASYIEPIMQVFKPAWRAGQYRAQVVDAVSLNGSFLSVQLKPSKQWPKHTAGQHISLTLEINGRLLTRVFTVASSAQQFKNTGLVRLLIKTNAQGRFTGLLNNTLKAGLWCSISAPNGDFVFKSTHTPATFIAGGSGITPMLAMLDDYLSQTTQKVLLVYYAKVTEHQCVDELGELAARFEHFSFLLLTREQANDITCNIKPWENPDIYCCGPAAFMQTVSDFAKKHDLNYYQEAFGLALPRLKDDSQFNVKINSGAHVVLGNDVLLTQFEEKKLPVKRGCGIGICHQCQCIKKSGVVRNLKTGELSDSGEQLIQLCVSQAVSDLELQL